MQAKGIAHFGLLCSLSLFTGFSHAMTVSDLLISEVMVNPAALSDARGEWFELYNPTAEEINLRGLTLGDDGNDLHRIESDLLILPGEYLTLARYIDPGFTPDYVYDGFTLSNSGDEIVFSDGMTELLRLEYGGGFEEAGRSRELGGLPMIESNYDLTLASLGYGYGDIGTPGEAGSTSLTTPTVPLPSAVPIPAAAWLFVSALLGLFSLSSRGSSPTSRYVNPAGAGEPRKRGPHSVMSLPVSTVAIGAA